MLVVGCSPGPLPGNVELVRSSNPSDQPIWLWIASDRLSNSAPPIVLRDTEEVIPTRFEDLIETDPDRRPNWFRDYQLRRLVPLEPLVQDALYQIGGDGWNNVSLVPSAPVGALDKPDAPRISLIESSEIWHSPCIGPVVDAYQFTVFGSQSSALYLIETVQGDELGIAPGDRTQTGFLKKDGECLDVQAFAIGFDGSRSSPSEPTNTCDWGCSCTARPVNGENGFSWILLVTFLWGVKRPKKRSTVRM